MTNSFNIRTVAAASAFAAISAMAFMAQTGTASAKSIASCEGNSRTSVLSCCTNMVQHKGLPFWMKQGDSRCEDVVKCKGGTFAGANRYCWVSVVQIEDSKGGKDGRRRGGKGRY